MPTATAQPTGERAEPQLRRALVMRTLARQRRLLIPAMLLLCLHQASEAAVPVLIGLVIDHAVIPRSWLALAVGLAALVALFTVLSSAYRFGARLANRALNAETHQLRVEIAARALDPHGVRTDLMPGEIVSVATADADVTSFVIRRIAVMCAALAGVAVGAGYLFVTDWVTGIVVGIAVIITLLLAQILSRPIERHTDAMQATVASASGQAADIMRGLRVLKGIGAEPAVRDRYRHASTKARDAAIRTAGGVALTEAVQQAMLALLIAAAVLTAGWRTLDGELSIGGLVAVVGVAVFLAEPISTLVMSIPMVFSSLAAAGRIGDFTARPPLITSGESAVTDPEATVAISDFRELSELPPLEVHPGQLMVLVCDDPALNDSLVAALNGEYEPGEEPARIRLGGILRSDLDLDSARSLLAVNPHQVDLFEGTLRSNIELVKPVSPADQDRLTTVLDASACAELVELFPDGLDHAIAPSGTNLSGGQRQRIALARALLADPPILVLCDPTTAVDAVTEQHIARSLRRLRERRATIVFSSSPALCAVADQVVLLSRSEVRSGTHDDLLSASAHYRELVLR